MEAVEEEREVTRNRATSDSERINSFLTERVERDGIES